MYYNTYMDKIKEASVAGTFYTSIPSQLKQQIEFFKNSSKNMYTAPTRAVIVPHAGLVFSGRVAWEGISQLDKGVKNIFIFAPAHKVAFDGLAISSYKEWGSPLGNIKINRTVCNKLIKQYGANINDEAFENEHSIEVEIPIIQSLFEKVNIIPVLIGKQGPDLIEQIISDYYEDDKYGFIISSDLSHFYTEEEGKKLDDTTANMIESGDIRQFKYEQACGAIGIAGLVQFANKKNYSLIRIDMTNSVPITGDKSRVVGYGSWFLYEGSKNEFIEKYYPKFPIDLAKLVIKSSFGAGKTTIHYPQIFDEMGACFVTLEKNNQLRGCIGSVIAHRPLVTDLVSHAKNAAFNDPRFKPLQKDEIDDIKVSVSILTEPKKIDFNGEKDLLKKIVKNKDGIIIKDGEYQAVYLPSVWEQIPDKKEFLNSLKVKAGLDSDYFSDTLEAYKFETTYIKE